MNEPKAHQFAHEWITAWNSHDLEAILAHYADEVEFTSPFVATLAGNTTGTLRGKGALREYFRAGLARFPTLRFQLRHVLCGVHHVTIVYRSVNDLLSAETMTLDASGTVIRAEVAYSKETEPGQPISLTEYRFGDYLLTDNPSKADLVTISALLHSTYWADDRSSDVIERSLRHSVTMHLFHRDTKQVGLIRGVTDRATFAWICDVVIDPAHRGNGLGTWMVGKFLEHPALQTISQHLCTKDAHALYERHGFQRIEAMRRSKRAMPFLLMQPMTTA